MGGVVGISVYSRQGVGADRKPEPDHGTRWQVRGRRRPRLCLVPASRGAVVPCVARAGSDAVDAVHQQGQLAVCEGAWTASEAAAVLEGSACLLIDGVQDVGV